MAGKREHLCIRQCLLLFFYTETISATGKVLMNIRKHLYVHKFSQIDNLWTPNELKSVLLALWPALGRSDPRKWHGLVHAVVQVWGLCAENYMVLASWNIAKKGSVGRLRNIIKNKISSQPRKRLHKCTRERKQFTYWIHVKPECDVHHRQSSKRWPGQKGILPFM